MQRSLGEEHNEKVGKRKEIEKKRRESVEREGREERRREKL
jgi:hypothetical protein